MPGCPSIEGFGCTETGARQLLYAISDVSNDSACSREDTTMTMSQQLLFYLRIQAGWIVLLIIALIVAIPVDGLAVRPGEISLAAEMSAAQRAVAAKHPDARLRNPDYLAEKFVSDDFWHYYHYSRDFDASMTFVSDLVRDLRIPRLGTFGISEADIPELTQTARKASSMKFNPVELPQATLEQILRDAC